LLRMRYDTSLLLIRVLRDYSCGSIVMPLDQTVYLLMLMN